WGAVPPLRLLDRHSVRLPPLPGLLDSSFASRDAVARHRGCPRHEPARTRSFGYIDILSSPARYLPPRASRPLAKSQLPSYPSWKIHIFFSRSGAMKRFSAVSLVVLFSVSAYAQEKPSISGKQDVSSAGAATIAPEEVRIRALQEQVRTPAEEVALLRGELKTIRDTKSADPATGSRLLLASTRMEPGVPVPAPEPQIAQTQTYG